MLLLTKTASRAYVLCYCTSSQYRCPGAADDFYAIEQLVASGRLNVITTEEFFALEAVTGGLGIKPVKPVNKMIVREITAYLTDAASQYEGGLPNQLKPGHTGIVFPAETGAVIDMKDTK